MNIKQTPVIVTNIGSFSIRSVLDSGFTETSEMAPEMHLHAFYELIIALNGTFCVELGEGEKMNDTIILEPGSICLIPPGIYHCTKEISDSPVKLALRFNISEDGSALALSFGEALRLVTSPVVYTNCPIFRELVEQIKEELNRSMPAKDEYIILLLGELYIELYRLLCNAQGEKRLDSEGSNECDTDIRRLQIEEYLYANFSEEITEEDLAKELAISKRQLSRILRLLFGTSFRQLLIDIRINRAIQLLKEDKLSNEEISFAVGYTSLSGFYTAFRGKLGCTVGQYRKRLLR